MFNREETVAGTVKKTMAAMTSRRLHGKVRRDLGMGQVGSALFEHEGPAFAITRV
jgi:hypothetical protein